MEKRGFGRGQRASEASESTNFRLSSKTCGSPPPPSQPEKKQKSTLFSPPPRGHRLCPLSPSLRPILGARSVSCTPRGPQKARATHSRAPVQQRFFVSSLVIDADGRGDGGGLGRRKHRTFVSFFLLQTSTRPARSGLAPATLTPHAGSGLPMRDRDQERGGNRGRELTQNDLFSGPAAALSAHLLLLLLSLAPLARILAPLKITGSSSLLEHNRKSLTHSLSLRSRE